MTTEPKEALQRSPPKKSMSFQEQKSNSFKLGSLWNPLRGLTLATGGAGQLRPCVRVLQERGGWRLGVLSALLLQALSVAIGAHRHGDEKAHRGIWLSFAFPDAFSRHKGHCVLCSPPVNQHFLSLVPMPTRSTQSCQW